MKTQRATEAPSSRAAAFTRCAELESVLPCALMLPMADRRLWVATDRPDEQLASGSPLPAVQLLSARTSDRLWTEYHPEVSVCLVHPNQPGVEARFRCRGRTASVGSNELMLFDVNDHHITTQVTKKADFSVVTIGSAHIRRAAEELGLRGPFHFRALTASDPRVVESMQRFIVAAGHGEDRFAVDCTFAEFVRTLIESCGEAPVAGKLDPVRHYQVRAVRDFLRDNFADNHSLDHLAAQVGLSKYWLARAFKDWVGLPPHAFLKLRRACEAKRMIEQGVAIDQVTAALGYVDVPLLTRTYKHYFGMPPARWRGVFRQNTPWKGSSRLQEQRS